MHHVVCTIFCIVAETTQSGIVSTTSFCETIVLFLNVIPLQFSYVYVCHLLFMSCFYITNEFHANFNYTNLIILASSLSQTVIFTIAPLSIMAIGS